MFRSETALKKSSYGLIKDDALITSIEFIRKSVQRCEVRLGIDVCISSLLFR
jgi:hypothetical protein